MVGLASLHLVGELGLETSGPAVEPSYVENNEYIFLSKITKIQLLISNHIKFNRPLGASVVGKSSFCNHHGKKCLSKNDQWTPDLGGNLDEEDIWMVLKFVSPHAAYDVQGKMEKKNPYVIGKLCSTLTRGSKLIPSEKDRWISFEWEAHDITYFRQECVTSN